MPQFLHAGIPHALLKNNNLHMHTQTHTYLKEGKGLINTRFRKIIKLGAYRFDCQFLKHISKIIDKVCKIKNDLFIIYFILKLEEQTEYNNEYVRVNPAWILLIFISMLFEI